MLQPSIIKAFSPVDFKLLGRRLCCCFFGAVAFAAEIGQANGTEIGRYRFEEGPAGSVATTVLDTSVPGGNDGMVFGAPIYSSDVPVNPLPLTGQANQLSLAFDNTKTEFVNVNATFPFNGPSDVTLEFWLKAPLQGHAAIFWSSFNINPDTNRFHIYLAGGTDFSGNGPQVLGMDYRSPDGVLHQLLGGPNDTPFVITSDQWTHVAVTRAGDLYSFYKDGSIVEQTQDVGVDLPNNFGWEMAGRSHDFTGLIDEIRFSDRALQPTEFLNAVPEPSSLALATLAFFSLAAWRRLR